MMETAEVKTSGNMKSKTRNVFLDQVCTKLKEQRPLGLVNCATRVERMANAPYASLWFRTRGCGHDHHGGCTACNYGASTPVSADEMVDYVREGLSLLDVDERTMLLVSPSGSMFDEWEVPPEARERIFQLVRGTKCGRYTCETRAETLTDEKVKQYSDIFDNKIAYIEMGLESANPWILKYCVNKRLSLDDYEQAVLLLRKYGVPGMTNVMLGSAFLSPSEAIEDAITSIKWAFALGVEMAVVFPTHVKQWTLLEWLWERGLYSPPSLWSLVEVLVSLGPHLASRVTISWYKLYNQVSDEGVTQDPKNVLGYLDSPATCVVCQPRVIGLLDTFRNTNDFEILRALANTDCECKHVWRALVEAKEPISLQERVLQAYALIGRDVLGVDWWARHGNEVMRSFTPKTVPPGTVIC